MDCLWLQTLLLQHRRMEGCLHFSFFSGAREPKISMAECSGRVIWIKIQFPAAAAFQVPALITRHGGQYERAEQNGAVSSHCFCRDKNGKKNTVFSSNMLILALGRYL